MENVAHPSISHPPMLPPPPPLADPSMAKERKRKHASKSLNGEKESRKANYMKKILNDDKATKAASFQKRKPTLKKKAHELQTYCDVSICMVCYDSKGNVDMWPENRKVVGDMINGYKYKLKEGEKRKNNIIGLLEGKKKKLEKKIHEDIGKSVKEVVEPLSKLIDGLSGDALRATITRLDAKMEYLKERIEALKSDSEKKEVKDVGDDHGNCGYNGQNTGQVGLVAPKSEESNGNCLVEPEPDEREPVVMIDNKASLLMADYGSILGQRYVGNNVFASRADPIELEGFDFDKPIEGYTTNNSMVQIGNNVVLDHSYWNSLGFGQEGTSFGAVLPRSYLATGNYLAHCPDGANNHFFQGLETNVNADSRRVEFSGFPLGSYTGNYMVGVGNNNGLFDKNCNSFGLDQAHGIRDHDPPQSSKMILHASPLTVWRPPTGLNPFGSATGLHPFGARSNRYF